MSERCDTDSQAKEGEQNPATLRGEVRRMRDVFYDQNEGRDSRAVKGVLPTRNNAAKAPKTTTMS